MGNGTKLNNLLWDGLEIWDMAVRMEHFWTLVTTHQLSTIHTHCTPVLIGIIFLCLPATLSMFCKTNYDESHKLNADTYKALEQYWAWAMCLKNHLYMPSNSLHLSPEQKFVTFLIKACVVVTQHKILTIHQHGNWLRHRQVRRTSTLIKPCWTVHQWWVTSTRGFLAFWNYFNAITIQLCNGCHQIINGFLQEWQCYKCCHMTKIQSALKHCHVGNIYTLMVQALANSYSILWMDFRHMC